MLRHIQTVLFDFDFTLADPSPWLLDAWTTALESIAISRPDEIILKRVIGRPLKVQYSSIVHEPASGSRFETFQKSYERYRDFHAPKETAIFPTVPALLGSLDANGLMLGIVSTGAYDRITAVLKGAGLDRFFPVIEATSHDKVVGIRAATAALGADAATTVYVGDHPEDCKAAKGAGVDFIAVMTGVHNEANFPDSTFTLPTIADLHSYLFSCR